MVEDVGHRQGLLYLEEWKEQEQRVPSLLRFVEQSALYSSIGKPEADISRVVLDKE